MSLSDVIREVWVNEALAHGFDGRTTAHWSDNSGWTGLAYCVTFQTPCIDLTTVAWFDEAMLGREPSAWPATIDRWVSEARMHHAFQLPAEWLGR